VLRAECIDLVLLKLLSWRRWRMMTTTATSSRRAPSTARAMPMASTTSTLALLVESSSGRSALTYRAQLLPNLDPLP